MKGCLLLIFKVIGQTEVKISVNKLDLTENFTYNSLMINYIFLHAL
jgi:hypothetical protein